MIVELPEGVFFSIVKGGFLIKNGYSKKGLKIVKSGRYVCILYTNEKKLEILRRANKGEKI